MKKLLTIVAALSMCLPTVWAAKPVKAIITDSRGKVQVKASDKAAWKKGYQSMNLSENMVIKTNPRSRVTVLLNDGSKIKIKANSQVKLNSLSEDNRIIEQQKGKSVFKISKLMSGRKFQCRTPVAVCSVRGTEFAVEVGENNESTFKVFEGLVNVSGSEGTEGIMLKENERLGLTSSAELTTKKPENFSNNDSEEKASIENEKNKENVGLEVSAELTKDAIQKAAADELRLAEYQQGKTIIDAFGMRVKIQEYIVRVSVNQANDSLKMIVLNERKDRFDYFSNIQTYDKQLPADLSVATKSWGEWKDQVDLNGYSAKQPDYFLVDNKSAASNLTDVVDWGLTGGHLTTTSNGYSYFYNKYYFNINNISKIAYQPTTIGAAANSSSDITWSFAGGAMPTQVDSYPSGSDKLHTKTELTFADGSTYQEQYYTIDDLGKIANTSDVPIDSHGYVFKTDLEKFNQEMVLSGSDFKGAGSKIDLCVEPKIFIDAGLITKVK